MWPSVRKVDVEDSLGGQLESRAKRNSPRAACCPRCFGNFYKHFQFRLKCYGLAAPAVCRISTSLRAA